MIIYIKENGIDYLACNNNDILSFGAYEDKVCSDNLTMWKVKNRKRVYAGCGQLNRESDILRYDDKLFDKEVTYDSLVNYTVPRMKELLGYFDCVVKDVYWRNEMLIVSDSKAFLITQNMFVCDLNDFFVIGSGDNYLMGALEVTKNLPIVERIKKIISALNEQENINLFPITLLNTKTGRKSIINNSSVKGE